MVVCGARAELSDVGEFAAVQRLSVFQDVEHRGVLGCEARGEHTTVSEDEIVCGDRITVGPFGVTPEVKRPSEPVRRVLPPLGHGGHGRGVFGVVLGETFEERHRDLGVLLGADDVGIEVGRLGEITDMNDLIAVAGGDGGAALAAARGEEGGKDAEREGGRGREADGGLKGHTREG